MTKEKTKDQSSLAQKAEEFYVLLLSDFEAAKTKYMTEDFVWENPLPDSVPFGGLYKGPQELLRYLGELNAAIEMNPLHITDFIVDGSTVVAIGIERETLVKRSGRRYTMPFVHVLRFDENGKISQVREYNDTTEMLKAFAG